MRLHNKIFLASKSPRRRELISQVFENIVILDSPLDEPRWTPAHSSRAYLELCLDAKFVAGMQAVPGLEIGDLLLVADTIVVFKDEVLGKPLDKTQASQMLRKLSGQWHKVFTGLELGRYQRGSWLRRQVLVESDVKFQKLTSAQIQAYVNSGEPMDKAGAYGFQAKGLQLVDQIRGSYTNIIGLPVLELKKLAQTVLE